jgi:hypothetical protein
MVSARVYVFTLLVSLAAVVASQAQVPYGVPGRFLIPGPAVVERAVMSEGMEYHHAVGLKKFINSFTSYQFPNPFPPFQDPLSRLEFPIDQWFFGLKGGCDTPLWSIQCQGWINLNEESALKMQDSDWDDPIHPDQKTIFSESECRLNKGLLLDAYLALANPLVTFVDFKPIVGYRYQHFDLTTHDGFQVDLQGNSVDLPGDGIEFRQTFVHYYVGALVRSTPGTWNLFPRLQGLEFIVQADYAWVRAKNEDLHLLRLGERLTHENTRGHAWHISLTAQVMMSRAIRARIEGDFNRITSTGPHRLSNRLLGIDFPFDGATVWSDQGSLSAYAEILF